MLQFDNLQYLHKHHAYLSTLLGTTEVFLVGGCVRDLLLGTTTDPTDIDITCAGNPDTIWEQMNFDESTTSRFRTEKFGTMTFIPKDETGIEYELTPFRTEGGYTDNRHPDKINRSNDILLDSARRDFSINSLYRYGTTLDKQYKQDMQNNNLEKTLKAGGNIFLADTNTLILQDHKSISRVFKNGICNHAELKKILHKQTDAPPVKRVESGKADSGGLHLSIIIDPHAGLQDLISGKLQTVGNPDNRFTEDALRIIRGLRFVNTLNQFPPVKGGAEGGGVPTDTLTFDFSKPTRLSMQKHAHLIQSISSERLHDEIVKVFKQDNPFGYISLVHELKLLPLLFPALAETLHNDQPVRYHSFDTYTYTMLCLHELQTILKKREEADESDYLVKLAMLYHDVGKPEQYEKMGAAIAQNPDNPDRSSYEYHTESGAKLATRDFKALSFSKKECEQIAWYIRRHHRPGEILDGKKEKRAVRLRKLMSDGGYQATMNLLDITIADRTGQYNPLQAPAIQEIQELKLLLTQLYEDEGRFTKQDMHISGEDIMKHLDIQPGPKIGELLEQCFNRVIADVNERNTKEKIISYVNTLEIDI